MEPADAAAPWSAAQAPTLYARLGYEVASELGGFPNAARTYVLRNSLPFPG